MYYQNVLPYLYRIIDMVMFDNIYYLKHSYCMLYDLILMICKVFHLVIGSLVSLPEINRKLTGPNCN